MKTADLSSGSGDRHFREACEARSSRPPGIDFEQRASRSCCIQLDRARRSTTPCRTPSVWSWGVKERDRMHGCEAPHYVVIEAGAPRCGRATFSVHSVTGTTRRMARSTCWTCVPADDETPLVGCAIDIGTTTVTGVLAGSGRPARPLAKASAGNGQIRYGADVINRIIEQTQARRQSSAFRTRSSRRRSSR